MLDTGERRAIIAERIAALAAAEGLTVADDPALLDEVSGLVEWPVPLIGSIDARFMDLPREVLTTTMRTNQKYFALETATARSRRASSLVANVEAQDGGAAIGPATSACCAHGCRTRVLLGPGPLTPLATACQARHARVPREARSDRREKRLDTPRRARGARSRSRGAERQPTHRAAIRRAALLCKADLVTGMVGEFPELQGKVGRYYALADGEDPQVADASRNTTRRWVPATGSHRAGLRRGRARGQARHAGRFFRGRRETDGIEGRTRAPRGARHHPAHRRERPAAALARRGRAAYRVYADQPAFASAAPATETTSRTSCWSSSRTGSRRICAAPVRGTTSSPRCSSSATRTICCACSRASKRWRHSSPATTARTCSPRTSARRTSCGAKRARTSRATTAPSIPRCSRSRGDRAAAELERATDEIREHAAREDFAGAMARSRGCARHVDVFFDKVTVNADDPAVRANRLRLLAGIRSALGAVADFSKIEG